MQALMHQVLSGLANGGIYASVALALVMIYQATHHVNFAQGEMAMFSTYVCWMLLQAGLPCWIAFIPTPAFAFIAAAPIQPILLRPVAPAPGLTAVVVFIGRPFLINTLPG